MSVKPLYTFQSSMLAVPFMDIADNTYMCVRARLLGRPGIVLIDCTHKHLSGACVNVCLFLWSSVYMEKGCPSVVHFNE